MDSKPLSIDSYNNTKDSLSQNQTNQDSTTQHNTDSLILNPNNAQEYFEYSKQRQQQKDKGAIPEGTQENLKTLQASKEYLALLHIQYCGDSKQVFGKGFKEALKEQSRLKLWYEIRYNSGSTKNKDIALRRFKQSNLFGLYENNDINNIILQPLYDSTPLTNNLNQYKVSLNEAITFFTFLNIAKHPQSHTYYTSIISLEAAIKKYFTNNDFPQSQSLDSITQAFLHTMKQYYIQEHNPSLSIGSIYIIQKSKNKPNVTDNIATINKRMWQNNASTFFVFYPEHISDIALQIRQKPNSLLYLIVCKDTKIDCAYLESTSKLYMSDFKDSQSTNYYLGTEIQHNTQSTQENTYLELEPNGNDIADTQQEYIFKNAEPILTINKHQSNILLYNIGFAKQGNSISNEISKDTKVNKLGIALRLKDNKAHSTDCSKEGNFTLHINELYIYCSTQRSSIPNTHTTQNQSQDSIDSMHDSHNTQGQPIIYLLNCENRKTYPIALQANTDTNGNIIQDKADNTSYNAILSTELNLDMKATTKLILSCNDLVAQHYSTYDIHKITGVGIVSVNYDLKQKAKKGESIIYKNVLQLKQTTTLDEMITNTDSILEVKIHNTQKPLKIDTTLECEALYYGYKLIQWAYMILPTKEYNPNKTKLQKDIDYYELPSDTYKGNIISFNPKEYLQSKENTRDTQTHQSSTTHISQANNTQESITTPNSQNANNNISNTTQTNTNTQITQQTHQSTQLAKLLSGEYTLILFAYQKTPAYHTTYHIQDDTTNQRLARQATTHTKLTYNPPLSLRFNGKELQILEWGEVTHRFKAQSGILENTDNNLASNTQTNTQDSTNNYSQNKDCIESGIYYVKNIHLPKETRFIDGFFTNSWNLGDKYFQLYQTKDSTKPINDDFITTTHYTIHGGSSYGDIKGVDLAAESKQFFNAMQALYKKYKNELESMGNVIKLEVGYGTGEMVLEVVRKWEYRGYDNPNKWATMSQFKLLKNDIELLSGGIVEPAGINPNPKRAGHNLSPEQQQKTSGSDTRIPVGEYEVFWRYSGKQVYARSTIDLEFINLLKLNGVCSKNDVRDFSINPHSVNKGKNQLYDSQRQKTLQSKTDNFKKQHDWDIHSHIMPELKAINGTDMGDRNYILIHNGDNGIWSDGCLLPGELENELEPKGHKNNDGLYQETLLKTMQLIKLLIEHDIEAYQNYAKGQSKSTIKKFIVRIKEENVKIYPKNKITKWEK